MIGFEESVVHRLWLASGIASVLAIVVAFALLPGDEGGESPADIAARYADGREGYLRASFAEVLSVALFLVFLAAFSAVLRRAEADKAPVAGVAVVAGSVAAALQIVSYALIATLAYRTAETGNEDVIMAFYDFSSLASGFAEVPLAVFLAVASAGIIRTRVAPAVFGYLGLAAAAFSLVAGASLARGGAFSVHEGIGFLALVIFWFWLLATSIALVVRGRPRIDRAPSSSTPG
jgi:hypothetical protein